MPKVKINKVKTKTERRGTKDPVQFSEFVTLVKAVAELRADITKLTSGLRNGGLKPPTTLGSVPTDVMRRIDPELVQGFKAFYRSLYDDYQRKTLADALKRFFLAWDDYQANKQTFLFALILRENEVEFVEGNKAEWTLARVLSSYFLLGLGVGSTFRQYTSGNTHHLLVCRSEHEMVYDADFDDDSDEESSDEDLGLKV